MDLEHKIEIKEEPIECGETNEQIFVTSGLESIKDKNLNPDINVKREIETEEELVVENFQAKNLDSDIDMKNEISIKDEPLDNCIDDENIQISEVDGKKKQQKRKRDEKVEKIDTLKEKNSSQSRRKELKKEEKTTVKKINLIWLHENIKSEIDAFKFLQDSRIIQENVLCDKKHSMKVVLCDLDPTWRCPVANCRLLVPVRTDTWLHGSTLPLKKIIIFIYCWSQNFISTKFCLEELNLSDAIAADFTGYLHEVCAHALINDSRPIGGEGQVVEVDETQFTQQKWNRDRLLSGQWIYGGICRETKEVFMFAIPDKNEETLFECIKSKIKPGTKIISDCWFSYKNIENIEGFNYKHFGVSNFHHFLEPQTKPIENSWKVLRYKNKEQRDPGSHILDSFICEFLWRKRNSNNDLFQTILNNIANFR